MVSYTEIQELTQHFFHFHVVCFCFFIYALCLLKTYLDKAFKKEIDLLYALEKEHTYRISHKKFLRSSLHLIKVTQQMYLYHRSDSVWGTDYIANPFFLNKKVSRTTIKNLRWQLVGEIIEVTFRKSSTSLVQQLKKKLVHKNLQQGTDYHSVYSNFFLSFWTNDVKHFQRLPKEFLRWAVISDFYCCPRKDFHSQNSVVKLKILHC